MEVSITLGRQLRWHSHANRKSKSRPTVGDPRLFYFGICSIIGNRSSYCRGGIVRLPGRNPNPLFPVTE